MFADESHPQHRLHPVRYRSDEEDSGRWIGFPHRAGDIVISTRSKSGTTWTQMICALLIFQEPQLPAPLADLSPWLDWLLIPQDKVYGRLAAQPHRRFIKTHTPLDGLPLHADVTYLVVARHPLDMAVSLYHQGGNLNRNRIRELTGGTGSDNRPQPKPEPRPRPRPDLGHWLRQWIASDAAPANALDSLPGVVHHLADVWTRRATQPNVVLLHYQDLLDDLAGQMRGLAEWLRIAVPDDRWPDLVEAATFANMRARSARLAPDPAGVMVDSRAFFRSGRSGSGRSLLTDDEYARYLSRVAQLAARQLPDPTDVDDLLTWLHRAA
ncbi:sulfotransferase domain-containing protein [Micromonospora sp. LOL_023]|uniref:sulfotransferase domain-containing protein n=1 Tax=Micromonospora sp. LOL_023 TaxID=3345418 RepID=UPI003A844FD8